MGTFMASVFYVGPMNSYGKKEQNVSKRILGAKMSFGLSVLIEAHQCAFCPPIADFLAETISHVQADEFDCFMDGHCI